jgi:DNA-binding SARP family transcriptional activator
MRGGGPSASLLRLRLIGQIAAVSPLGAVALPRVRKTRALLAILALAGGRPVLRERIAALLWSRRGREQARASLRQCVHELQEFCVEHGIARLRTGRQHLVLDMERIWVDVVAITTATAAQAELLDLLQGELLEDLIGLDDAFDVWIAGEARRLREAAVALAGMVLDRQSEPEAMTVAARRLVNLAPANETGWQRLIQAHLACGERAAAFEAFDRCARALAEATGRPPGAETLALLHAAPPVPPASPQPMAPSASPRRQTPGVWLGVSVFRAAEPRDAGAIAVEVAEEIATALARFRWINIIAPGSMTGNSSDAAGQAERWRHLDVDFLLDGAIQRRANPGGREELRVTVRLLDMRAGGEMLWSQRFDRDAADLLALQDDIAAATAAQVDPEILSQESRRAARRPLAQATPLELMLRAVPAIFRLVEPDYSEAGHCLERAAEMAPGNAAILGWYACWHLFLVGQSFAADPAAAMRRAGELAERAVALDPGCARALSIAAHVNSFLLHKDIDETIGLHERALALNPNLPFAWATSCLSLTYAGRHDLAMRHGERARELSPFDPHSFFFDAALMAPLLIRREFDRVVALGRRSQALNPSMMGTMKGLLSALGHLGRQDEAAELRAKMQRFAPGLTLASAMARSPLRRPEDRAIYAEGLRLAGVGDG